MKTLWLVLSTLATILGFIVMAVLFLSVAVTFMTVGGYGIYWLPAAMILIALGAYLRNRGTRRKPRPQGHHPC